MVIKKRFSKVNLKSSENVRLIEDHESEDEVKRIYKEFPSILQIGSVGIKDPEFHIRKSKPFVRCDHNIKIEELVRQVITKRWRLSDPRIVVFILSNMGSIHRWNNEKQIKSFQKGLMKAAESTDMWVIVNGLDMGSTTIIGDAIHNYANDMKYKKQTSSEKSISNFNFIGIANEDMLRFWQTIAKSHERLITIPVRSEGLRSVNDQHRHSLNHNLTHYVLINDQTLNKEGVNDFIVNLMTFLAQKQRKGKRSGSDGSPPEHRKHRMSVIEATEVPVVSVVIKGGYNCSRLVLTQIQKCLPVVVLRGTGGLADLLSFVNIEMRDRCLDVWDPDFVDAYMKPELTLRIVEMFPKLRNNSLVCNQFRNRILESIRLSRRDGQNFLTVVNMLDTFSCNLDHLSEYLLSAVFKSQSAERPAPSTPEDTNWRALLHESRPSTALIRQDLMLCVDWNCPEVAKEEVLSKDPEFLINNEKLLFEDSLIRSNRWQFVDLFLYQKFKLRSFVSPKRLKRMFSRIVFKEFFIAVCWEGILGRSPPKTQSDRFIYRELNWLIESCTGIGKFVDESELDFFVTQQFPNNEREAERKALELIVFWALFDFRAQLVRILWRHSDQPLHLALIIAMSYDRMASYVSEQTLCDQLKQESKVFVSYGCDLLEAVYKDSARRAEQVLNERTKGWNYKTPVDLAALGKFRAFLGHEACQRWITNQIYANIAIKDVRFGFLRVPAMFKLLISAYLLFPMYIFIKITNKSNDDEVDAEDQDQEMEENIHRIKSLHNFGQLLPERAGHVSRKGEDKSPDRNTIYKNDGAFSSHTKYPPFHELVRQVWTAPITKFWNYQFFYMLYLSIFSVAVLYPRCGNMYLDMVVSTWMGLIVVDAVRQSYLIHIQNINYSLVGRVSDICVHSLFLFFYVAGRLIQWSSQHIDPYTEKVVLCLALLYSYYILFTVFLPISATLGPLLYRLKIMILVDFLNFIRLSILVMISFGVVLQAILYPDLTVDVEVFRKAYHRSFFSMFKALIEELEVDQLCEQTARWDDKNNPQHDNYRNVCTASTYSNETCRVTGLWPYVFETAYYILLKVILMTLLMAIFASSAVKLTADTDSIWKYQRYGLVMDFLTRSPCPPPLNIFYYIFWIIRRIFIFCCFEKKKVYNLPIISELFGPIAPPKPSLSPDDCTYLRLLAADIYDLKENQLSSESLATSQLERIKANAAELELQRRSLRQLKGKVSEVDRSIRQSLVFLESISHSTTRGKGFEAGVKQHSPHMLSRHSPYPNTTVQRYPVSDRYVSWDVMHIVYDPITYTKPKGQFTPVLQPYVDIDLLALQTENEPGVKLPALDWNRVSVSGAGITTDRQTWEQPSVYKLLNGIPVNPFGRTGLTGRGALLRWGPNHYICLVITRMNSKSLEVLIERQDIETNKISLIVRFIPGEMSYVSIENHFKTSESQHKIWTKAQTMIDYFFSDEVLKKTTEEEAQEDEENNRQPSDEREPPNVEYHQLLRGYFDDPLNTDQAWKEIELWHFHYNNHNTVLDNRIKDSLEWREVTESLFSVLTLSQSKVLQNIVDKLGVNFR